MKTPIIFMNETEMLEAKNKKVINLNLATINSIEEYPIMLYTSNELTYYVYFDKTINKSKLSLFNKLNFGLM